MRLVFGLVLVIGVALAGFAVYMARGYITDYQIALARERAANAQMVRTVDVFVAKDSLAYGDQITADSVRQVRWPEDAVPEGTFTSLEDLFPPDGDKFRTVLRAMEKDEAILAVKVTEPGGDAGVSSRLSAGMRAFAIRVDVASGVSGFLRPGDRVDVYWTGRAATGEEGQQEGVTKLIQTSILIIAVDQTADTDRTSPTIARTVTVEATPQQVAALAQAQATGSMSLSLVGTAEIEAAGSVEVNQDALLGIVREAPTEAAPTKEVCTVRTRRGSEIIETVIPCPSE